MSSTPDGSPVAHTAPVSTAANPLAEARRCRYRRRGYSSTSSRQRRHSLIFTSHHFHFSSFVKQEDTLVYYTNFFLLLLPFVFILVSFPSLYFHFLSPRLLTEPFSFLSSIFPPSHLTSFLSLFLPFLSSLSFNFPLVYFRFQSITVRVFHLLPFRVSSFCFHPLLLPLSFDLLVSFPTLSSLSLASCFLCLSLSSSLVL